MGSESQGIKNESNEQAKESHDHRDSAQAFRTELQSTESASGSRDRQMDNKTTSVPGFDIVDANGKSLTHEGRGIGDALKDAGKAIGDIAKDIGKGPGDIFRDISKPTEKPELKPPMSEKELGDMSKKYADMLADGRWKFGSEEEKAQFMKDMKDAEERGQLKLLVAKINEEMAKKGSDLSLDLKTTHQQDRMLPELDPFDSWNHFNIDLRADDGTVLDNMNFDGRVTHHPGMYPVLRPRPIQY